MTNWGFHDLHSFKDYVGFVKLCAPDQFPKWEWTEQLTLDRAFEGLRYGLDLTAKEKGESPKIDACRKLVEAAYGHYKGSRMREGIFALQELQKLLKKIPSQ